MGGRSGGRAAVRSGRTLIGREALVGELTRLADDAAAGAGSLVLLTGEAGIGKTSVVRAVAAHVRDDLAVTWGHCNADRSAPPFWPWRDVLDVDRAEAAGGRDDAIGAERYELLRALRRDLLAPSRPRLHVVEDLQWADVASVLLLAHVGAAVGQAPLLLVATLRTGEPLAPPLAAAIEQTRTLAVVRDLAPLGRDAISALIRETGAPAEDDLVALVLERTGGNPLFLTELIRSGSDGADLERTRRALGSSVPARIEQLIGDRLGRLPDAVAETVVAASVIGFEGDDRALASACRAEVEPVVELLEQARAARLLDAAPPGRWRFRHELVRDAVYSTIGDAERARIHAVVLDALAATGTTPASVLARHALGAQPLFDAERAVALAAQAGREAFDQHAYEEAVGWFEQALTAAPDDLAPRWRAEVLVMTGEARRHLGELDPARGAFAAAAGLSDDPALLARAALGYADPGADLGIAYRAEDAVVPALLERAIAAQPEADSVTRVRLEARLAAERYFSDRPEQARELVDAAVQRAERLDDAGARCAAHAVAHDAFVVGQADLREQLDGSAQLLAWARADGSTAARLTAHRARVLDLLAAGDIPALDREILAFRRAADPLDAAGYAWWPALWAAMRALLEGDHDTVEPAAFAAYERGEGSFTTLAFVNLSFLLFFLRREQGRFAEMEQATREYAASHADIPALRVSLVFLLAETGRLDEARALLAGFSAAELDRLRDRNWPTSWFQLARAVALVGDASLAERLLDPATRPTEVCVQVSLGTACLGSTALATGWLLHARGDLDAAAAAYTEAAEVNARLGARSWLAQARTDHARSLADRGGPGDLEQARALVELVETSAPPGLRTLDRPLAELRSRLAGPAPAETTAARPEPATFVRSGATWELHYADRGAQVRDARGLRDIAYLLAHPDEPVSVMELLGDAGSTSSARGAPALDERARREIRERLRELEAEIADAEDLGDGERAALAREQRQQLAETVARDLGLGGRARRLDDPIERARKTVSTRIRRAIVAVGEVHPELGRHLERSIDTGTWCAYRPAEPVHWRT